MNRVGHVIAATALGAALSLGGITDTGPSDVERCEDQINSLAERFPVSLTPREMRAFCEYASVSDHGLLDS